MGVGPLAAGVPLHTEPAGTVVLVGLVPYEERRDGERGLSDELEPESREDERLKPERVDDERSNVTVGDAPLAVR